MSYYWFKTKKNLSKEEKDKIKKCQKKKISATDSVQKRSIAK